MRVIATKDLDADVAESGQYSGAQPGPGCQTNLYLERTLCAGTTISPLGEKTRDMYLNERAYWHNFPAAVWGYKLGGYQVLKKWLSYRERDVLGRALAPEKVLYFAEMARRIGGMLLVTSITA